MLTGDYEEFLGNVDAVYIASPNETHFEYAKKAIELNKPIIGICADLIIY